MGSITSYGLHWRWDFVELDGHRIFGWRPNNDGWAREPDEPAIEITKMPAVYALQESNRSIIYIGKTSRLMNRLWAHTRNNKRGRWTHFTWFGLGEPSVPHEFNDGSPTTELEQPSPAQESLKNYALSMTEIEALLITVLEPRLNRQSGQWSGRKEYLQFSHFEDVSNRDLWGRMGKKRLRKVLKQ